MLLCLSSSDWRVLEESPDASSDEPFNATDRFAFGLPVGDSAVDVGLGGWVASPLRDGDVVEGAVESSVAAAVEPMTGLVLA